MDPRDRDTLDAFARRFAAIDREIPPAPALGASSRPLRPVVGALLTVVASLVVVTAVAGALNRSVVMPPVGASPPLVAVSPSPSPSPAPSASVVPTALYAFPVDCGPMEQARCDAFVGNLVAVMAEHRPDKTIARIVVESEDGSHQVDFTDGTVQRADVDVFRTPFPSSSPSLPPGITRDEAIEVASDHATLPDLIDATVGPIGDVRIDGNLAAATGAQPGDLVWTVSFEQRVAPCPPDQRCLESQPGTDLVVLDYRTGRFLAETKPVNGAQIVCTLGAACDEVVALVPPEAWDGASLVAIADSCPPSGICDRLYPFDAVVAVVPGAGEEQQVRIFEVVGTKGPERIMRLGELPDHVRALMPGA